MAARQGAPKATGAAAHVAARVREHRKALGLSQEELARACHVSRQTISNWETARTLPDIQSLTTLARLAGTTVDELIGNEAPAVLDQARAARRDMLVVDVAWNALFIVSIGLIFFRYFAEEMKEVSGMAAFASQLLNNLYLYLGGGLLALGFVRWRLCKRNGLKTGYDVAEFVKGIATVPGSWQDRFLRFQARWYVTFGYGMAFAASVCATVASLLVLGDAFPPQVSVAGSPMQVAAAQAHPQWFVDQLQPLGLALGLIGLEAVCVIGAFAYERRRNKKGPKRRA